MDDKTLSLKMRRLIDQENKQILPHKEETEVINLGNNEEKKSKSWYDIVGNDKEENNWSPPWIYERLCLVLSRYVGVNTKIVKHRLPLKSKCKLIQQKLRRMKLEMLLKIKEEVKKQFDARFLKVQNNLNGWLILCQSQGKMRKYECALFIEI